MAFKPFISAACILVFAAFKANASVVYNYTGNNFTTAAAPYDTSMSITLQLETASPLSGTGAMVNVSSEILSYTAFDGVTTLTEADSVMDILMNIDTTTGQPTEWAIHVTNEIGKSAGDMVNRMNSIYYEFSGGPDRALEAECAIKPIEGGECMGLINGASADVFNSPGASGTWSVVPIPAAVWLFCSGLFGLIQLAGRKQSWLNKKLIKRLLT
jgi:hypothetical protein